MHAITVALFVAMFMFCSYLSGSVQAYLDPGTGSMALQLLIGGVVAVLATVRVYWGRLKSLAARKTDRTTGLTGEASLEPSRRQRS